jgi:hypothetical protein
MKNTELENYCDELDFFGSEENFSNALGMLFDFGDTHEEMHECFKATVKFVTTCTPLELEGNEESIKEVVFGLLEFVVNDRISDMLCHHWEYKEYTPVQFVRLLNEPLEALACTYHSFIGGSDDEGIPADTSIH